MTKPSTTASASFIAARVVHSRLRPKKNRFRYQVPYVAVPEGQLASKQGRGLLSIDGMNLFSVRTGDYGDAAFKGVAFARAALERHQIREADGELVLVTLPRVFGVGFNPVSFWLCPDRNGALRAVIAEVNNTFGERHFYLCAHSDRRPIAPQDTLLAEKVFHVSPFMKVEGHYRFAFAWTGRSFGVRIDLFDEQGMILTTAVAGERQPVTNGRLAWALAANPLLMIKVLGLIHYQAARLWLKGIAHFRKPPPPAEQLTR